jgi:hypothetical protein
MHYLGLQMSSFHNLTDALVEELLDAPHMGAASIHSRRAAAEPRLQLRDVVEAGSNLAVFQVTTDLPLSLDIVFTGSLPDHAQVALFTHHEHRC